MRFLSRPGISDAACLILLLLSSLAGAFLEPAYRDFWLVFPLFFEVPLLCTALLLVSRSVTAGKIAFAFHIALLIGSGLCLALSFFLLVTILFAGTAIILGPFSLILVLNSVFTMQRIAAQNRATAGLRTS
jgi:hypothetical protein